MKRSLVKFFGLRDLNNSTKMINKDTLVFGSFSKNPGNNGTVFFNSKFEDYDFGVQKFDRIILNNPTNCLPFLDKAMALVVEKGMIHFYSICQKDGSFPLSEYLAEGFECLAKREVHAYSPSSSLFVFDIRRNLI